MDTAGARKRREKFGRGAPFLSILGNAIPEKAFQRSNQPQTELTTSQLQQRDINFHLARGANCFFFALFFLVRI